MAYNLITTDEMNDLLDNCVDYLIHTLMNNEAAAHLLDSLAIIYQHLEDNPHIYQESQDPFMKTYHYHEVKIPKMDYIIVYKIEEKDVYILGIYHSLEDYCNKIKILWRTGFED